METAANNLAPRSGANAVRTGLLKAYVALVDLAAVAALALLPLTGLVDRAGTVLLLAALAAAVGARPIRIARLRVQVGAFDLFVFGGLLTMAPLAAPLVALAGVIGATLGPHRRPLSMRTAFNLGAVPLSASLAALTFSALLTDGSRDLAELVVPLLVATALYFLANTALAAVAIAVETRRNFFVAWGRVGTVERGLLPDEHPAGRGTVQLPRNRGSRRACRRAGAHAAPDGVLPQPQSAGRGGRLAGKRESRRRRWVPRTKKSGPPR